MRSLIVSIFVIAMMIMAVSAPTLAQTMPIDKGVWKLGGGLSFTSYGGDYYKDSQDNSATLFTFNPAVGYFITKGVMIGGEFNYSKLSQGDFSLTGFGIGPVVTYYFQLNQEKTGKGAIYPYIGAAFLYSKTTDKEGSDEAKSHMTTFLVGGGMNYMLTNSVGLFGELQYDADSWKADDVPAGVDNKSISGSRIMFFTGFNFFIY